MSRLQNRIKQALYRPSKSGLLVSAAIEAVAKLGKEIGGGMAKALAEEKKDGKAEK